MTHKLKYQDIDYFEYKIHHKQPVSIVLVHFAVYPRALYVSCHYQSDHKRNMTPEHHHMPNISMVVQLVHISKKYIL